MTTNNINTNNANNATNNANNAIQCVVTIDGTQHTIDADNVTLLGIVQSDCETTPYKYDDNGNLLLDKNGNKQRDDSRKRKQRLLLDFANVVISDIVGLAISPLTIRTQRQQRETPGTLSDTVNVNVRSVVDGQRKNNTLFDKTANNVSKLSDDDKRALFKMLQRELNGTT